MIFGLWLSAISIVWGVYIMAKIHQARLRIQNPEQEMPDWR